jgi:hypothetical protein
MAQFLKVEAVLQPQTLIPISEIVGMVATSDATDTTLVITLKSGSYTVVVADPAGGVNAMVKAFNDAIVANPGGVVSTVVPPLTTAQVVAPTKGRMLITTPAKFTQFASCVFAA